MAPGPILEIIKTKLTNLGIPHTLDNSPPPCIKINGVNHYPSIVDNRLEIWYHITTWKYHDLHLDDPNFLEQLDQTLKTLTEI